MATFVSRATGTGGRGGLVWSEAESYRHAVAAPGTDTGAVTPEEMLAGAWAACFGGAFALMAGKRGLDASEARFHAAVTLEAEVKQLHFEVSRAELNVEVAGIDDEALEQLVAEAHAICPISKLFVGGAADVRVGRSGGADGS